MNPNDLENLINAQTVEEVWAHLCCHMEKFGFDRLLYGFTRFRTANSFGDPQDLLILCNHDEKYINGFIEKGHYFHAPMVRWAAENVGACSWSWIADHAKNGSFTEAEQRVVDFNRLHGVNAGYSVSFKDSSVRSKGALGLIGRDGMSQGDVDEIWSKHGDEIQVVANVAHLKIICLPYSGTRRPLTPRQREALEWVGDGKTTQDIATIMGLTPATIEKHLRLAREALNVETTAQAVLKASFQNQIFLLEA
ncbi:LuxR family transcriptional regulator [Actibacterium lipolyticum]|uniref:Transcriptional activator protein LuxR n=1 Tax=Actibacterium lipolyticum TaxID=1524263 RepID=A0A238JWL4_9RHOB|nr:LuxR family transcriptional regulator [Actibacterium lipolyticum]SMX35040.1 Transcriptional activator protein LuxR [Actibacterium lipolyticum]